MLTVTFTAQLASSRYFYGMEQGEATIIDDRDGPPG